MDIKEKKEITITKIPKEQINDTIDIVVNKGYRIIEKGIDYEGNYFLIATKKENKRTTDIYNLEQFI